MKITNEKTGVAYFTETRKRRGIFDARVYRSAPWQDAPVCASFAQFATRDKARHYAESMASTMAENHAYIN